MPSGDATSCLGEEPSGKVIKGEKTSHVFRSQGAQVTLGEKDPLNLWPFVSVAGNFIPTALRPNEHMTMQCD